MISCVKTGWLRGLWSYFMSECIVHLYLQTLPSLPTYGQLLLKIWFTVQVRTNLRFQLSLQEGVLDQILTKVAILWLLYTSWYQCPPSPSHHIWPVVYDGLSGSPLVSCILVQFMRCPVPWGMLVGRFVLFLMRSVSSCLGWPSPCMIYGMCTYGTRVTV